MKRQDPLADRQSKPLGISCFAREKNLMQLYAHQLRYQAPLFPRVAPDGDGVQVLKRVEVALIHGRWFVKINLADELAIIAADNIRIVFGHSESRSGGTLIVELFVLQRTKVVHLSLCDIWPIVPRD